MRLTPQERATLDYYTRVRRETGEWPRSRDAAEALGTTAHNLGNVRHRLKLKGHRVGVSGANSTGWPGYGDEPTPGQRKVLGLMAGMRAGDWWPSLSDLAGRLGISINGVKSHLVRLEAKGCVERGPKGVYRIVAKESPERKSA